MVWSFGLSLVEKGEGCGDVGSREQLTCEIGGKCEVYGGGVQRSSGGYGKPFQR